MGFKILYFSVYVRLFLNYGVCACTWRVCLRASVRALCAHASPRAGRWLVLMGSEKWHHYQIVWISPPPRGQTQRAGVKRCSTLRWKGNQRSALCSRSAMITPSPLSTTDTAEDRGHCLCTSVVLILNFHRGILFVFLFFFFWGHILKSENIWETRNKEGQRSPSRRYANLDMITEEDHRER